MTNTTKITAGIVTGTLIGVTLGLLLAPRKGAKTRAIIAEKTKNITDCAAKAYDKAKEMLGLNSNQKEHVAV